MGIGLGEKKLLTTLKPWSRTSKCPRRMKARPCCPLGCCAFSWIVGMRRSFEGSNRFSHWKLTFPSPCTIIGTIKSRNVAYSLNHSSNPLEGAPLRANKQRRFRRMKIPQVEAVMNMYEAERLPLSPFVAFYPKGLDGKGPAAFVYPESFVSPLHMAFVKQAESLGCTVLMPSGSRLLPFAAVEAELERSTTEGLKQLDQETPGVKPLSQNTIYTMRWKRKQLLKTLATLSDRTSLEYKQAQARLHDYDAVLTAQEILAQQRPQQSRN